MSAWIDILEQLTDRKRQEAVKEFDFIDCLMAHFCHFEANCGGQDG